MKRILLSAIVTCCGVFISNAGFSQSEKNQTKKDEEIIIRKKGDDKEKTLIVIDGNQITVNGKPLADYKGDAEVFTRKIIRGNSGNFLFTPGNNFRLENLNRAFLGVQTEKSDKGALIKTVTKGSSAEKAGLKENDVITQVGDKKIASAEELSEVIKTYKPGDEVKIHYLRNGKKKDTKIQLGKTPDSLMAFNFNFDSLKNFRMPDIPKLYGLQGKLFNPDNFDGPKLGLKIQDTEEGNGAKILDVDTGSAAEKAGLKKDDIITEINGEKVSNVTEIRKQMARAENKERYNIKAKRNNTDMNFEVKVPKKLNSANL